MQKLFMDLDDTYFDTERYLEKLLNNVGLPTPLPGEGNIYALSTISEYKDIILEAMSDYSYIPKKEGADLALELLSTEYEVIFCSSYTYENEYKAKKSFANRVNKDIILCTGDKFDKSHVDMRDSIFIENDPSILDVSSAKVKIQMCNQDMLKGITFDYKNIDLYATNWSEIVDYLMEVDVNAELRRRFCERIQEFHYSGE